MKIERLTAKDYDEWLYVLNTVFAKQNKKEMNFENELPKMCVKDDYHMGMHLAVKDEGKICALLGVYPIKTQIGDKELLFSTVGNVATLPECEGRGYMKALMGEAMAELERIGADASRLGGARQRYNRYGYEACGRIYKFSINNLNTKYCFDDKEKITFKQISLSDKTELAYINRLRKSSPMHVIRSDDSNFSGDFYSLCAWRNIPKIALDKNGEAVGYISVSEDGKEISDIMGKNLEVLKNMVYNLQMNINDTISFTVPTYNIEAVRYFSSVSQQMSASSPCHFKIINFDKVADALLKMKKAYVSNLLEGEAVIGIKEWGNLLIYNKNGETFCKKTEEKPEIEVDKLTVTRLLFGAFDANSVVECDSFLSSVLPLPLSWNTLDRV